MLSFDFAQDVRACKTRKARQQSLTEVIGMVRKTVTDKLSIYVPQRKMEERPVERLIKLGEKRDRSVNYLVVEAILDYLKREESKK